MVASVEKTKLKIGGWVRIEGGYSGQYNGRPAKVLSIRRSEGAALLAISESDKAWFACEYYTPITQAEAIALQKQLEQPDALDDFLAEVNEALGDNSAPPSESSDHYKVGDLLETSDGHLALIEACDRDGFTLLINNGKRLSGTVQDFKRWGYQKIWSKGDRVTPKHNPGSRYGTITGFNLRNKKTPLLVQFDGSQTEGKWGKDAVIPAGNQPSALSPQPSEVIDAELLPSRSDRLAQIEAEIEAGIQLCKQGEQQIWIGAYMVRAEKLWEEANFSSFEEYCKQRWGWEKSNAHEVAGAGEVILQLQQSGVPDLPTSVAAIRPLRKLLPEQRLQVIQQASTESGKLTTEAVKRAIALLQTPPPKPYNSNSQFQKGDFVEGTDDDSNLVQGYVAAVGIGYLRLEDNTAIYNPKPATPTIDHPDTWKNKDRLKAAGVQFRTQEIPRAKLPPLLGSDNEEDEPTDEEKALLSTIQDLSKHCSEVIYMKLIQLGRSRESLLEMTEEIEVTIAEMLESRLLKG